MNSYSQGIGHADRRPLICHIVFRLDYGGLENGVVNLVNGLPREEFRHAVIALTQASSFRERIVREDVEVHELNKRAGKDPATYFRLHRLLRNLKPAIVHTRNIGTMDCAVVAALAAVPARVHGEHGWDVHDPDGVARKYVRQRRVLGHFIQRFVTVSADLENWLVDGVGIARRKVRQICNGVDTERFSPRRPLGTQTAVAGFPTGSIVVGSVTRFDAIKDPLNLVRAFITARGSLSPGGLDVRLLMVGDGPLREQALQLLAASGHGAAAWLPGSRDDVAQLLTCMDVFVLGSYREGISNTVLEAMATGLPVIASATGGNLELIAPHVTGALVSPGDSPALARIVIEYAKDRELRVRQGAAARARTLEKYSLSRMLGDYGRLYHECHESFGAAG